MKKLKLFFALFAMLALNVGNAWGATYKLTKVTSVSAGEMYVFEQGGYVMNNTVSSSALQCVNTYKTTGLAGTESYVWTLESATDGFYMKNVSNSQYLNNSSSTGVSFGNKASIWKFTFDTDGIVAIQNTKNSNRFLGWTNATSHAYKAYATSNISKPDYPHDITVYKLEVEAAPSYVITPTSNNDSWGTVSLSGAIINAEPKAGYCVSTSTPYEVKSGKATVTQNGNAFAVNASSDCTIQINFEALPTYIVTWIVNGDTKTLSPASVYEGDALGTLPTPNQSDICTDKVFVGWTTETNKDYKHATDAPELITKDTKPSGNTTYYAVFATEGEGGGTPTETWEQTTSVAVGDLVVIAQVDNGTKEMTGLGKTPETANNNYGVGTDFTTNPNGTLIWTVEEGNTSGQFSFNNGTYYLNLGANENYLSYSATKTATSSWTVSTSGERAVVTNANYDSRKIMWNKNNTRFASYSKNHGDNSGQYYYHIVFYKKSGGISYSDYTTSCSGSTELVDSLTAK